MPTMTDRFQNVLSGQVNMSAANVLTFLELNTGVSLGAKMGLVIDQIDYNPAGASWRQLDAATDEMYMALCTSSSVTDLTDMTDNRLLDSVQIYGDTIGTAGTQLFYRNPLVTVFSPPLIHASPQLYFAMQTGGFASAGIVRMRLRFRFIKLSTEEYLELAEQFILSS